MILSDGIKFGFFMQLSIGPLALMLLNTSSQYGYINGFTLMGGIVCIDALYMFLSCMGVARLLQKKNLRNILKLTGGIILILFGINSVAGYFNVSLFPKTGVQEFGYKNLFLQGIFLTASNPLTIIFLGGIFTSRIIEKGYTQRNIFIFALGCLLARICFLILLVITGNMIHAFLPVGILKVLNVMVGMIIIFFGIKLVMGLFRN
jgi:threonine/homoserine/homoserine lactone efflux protein